jgi:hypothetical protein
MRTPGPLPIAGADEDFTVAPALLAMEFVNWHEERIIGGAKISSGKRKVAQFTLLYFELRN